MTHAIEIIDVTKRYGDLQALAGVSTPPLGSRERCSSTLMASATKMAGVAT